MKKSLKLFFSRFQASMCLSVTFVILLSGLSSPAQKQGGKQNRPVSVPDECNEVFFEEIGDLPGDCISSLPTDISSDGLRVVLMSSADEPEIHNDGGVCDPWLGWPHSNEAAGWTRPCRNIPFFTPPTTGTGGLIGLGYLLDGNPGHHESIPRGISPDGKIVVGYSNYNEVNNVRAVVFRKDDVAGLALIDSGCIAYDVCQPGIFPSFQADPEMHGRIIVGYSNTMNNYANRMPGARAIYWDDWDHALPLPYPADSLLPDGEKIISSAAVCISDDGRIIGGNFFYNKKLSPQHFMSLPCVWIYNGSTRSDGMYELLCVLDDVAGGDHCATINQVSGNGMVLVGYGHQTFADPECWYFPSVACKWTLSITGEGMTECGLPEPFPYLQGYESSSAHGVSYDGSNITGVALNVTGPCQGETFVDVPVIWDGNHLNSRPVNLAKLLEPLVPQGWTLFSADGISADGRVITGYAFDADWNTRAWVAGLPVEKVPLSNWAVIIAVIMIILITAFRFISKK